MEVWKILKYWLSNFVSKSIKRVAVEKVSICWGSSHSSFQDWNLSLTIPGIYILIDWYISVSIFPNIQHDIWEVKTKSKRFKPSTHRVTPNQTYAIYSCSERFLQISLNDSLSDMVTWVVRSGWNPKTLSFFCMND